MKKSIFTKMGAAAMVLTLVTASLVGGTFAKYATEMSGTAKATAAKWDVKFSKDVDGAVDFNDAYTLVGTGGNNTLLPGDKGSFDIQIIGKDAEVGYEYTIQIAEADSATLKGMKFYSTDAVDAAGNYNGTLIPAEGLTDKVQYNPENPTEMNKTITVYWQLPNGDDNAADTAMAGKEATYSIKMTAEQLTSTP